MELTGPDESSVLAYGEDPDVVALSHLIEPSVVVGARDVAERRAADNKLAVVDPAKKQV